ncbi:MAG: polysaccharide deacetylase family protein [Peptostreptococcaceae bacterium]
MRLGSRKTKSLISSVLFFAITICSIFAMVYGIRYICYKQGDTNMPIYKVDTDDKKISLSFDVAWGADNIDDILDVLDKYDVKATFFLVGSWVDDNKELVEKIYKKGHELGNHSNTHANTSNLSDESIIEEIETTTTKIYDVTGEKTTLYRPPFGDIDSRAMDICKALGYQVVKWDIDSLDWKEIGPTHVTDRVIRNAQPGSIVLFHANVQNIELYLDDILSKLQKENYRVVPVSELIYKDNYTIDSNGVQKIKE